MICPKCGKNTNGIYCSYCGTLLTGKNTSAQKASDDFSDIDFVPEEEEWGLDTNKEEWREAMSSDLDETVVLEPLDMYKPGEKRKAYQADTFPQKTSQSGKYGKYGKDPYDIPEDEAFRHKLVYEEETIKKKKKKKGRVTSSVKTVGKTSGKAVGKIVGGTAGHMLPFALRLVSFAALGIIVARLFAGFWAQREALGSISQTVSDRNYAQALYLILSVCLLAYGALSMLWILTRRKMPPEGRLRRFDTGRGLTAFVVFTLFTFLAARTALYMPSAPHILSGLGQFLLVLASCQGVIYTCALAGIVCCIIRKILKH